MESFEAIAENLVNQEGFTSLKVIGNDVTVIGEKVSTMLCLTVSAHVCCTPHQGVARTISKVAIIIVLCVILSEHSAQYCNS